VIAHDLGSAHPGPLLAALAVLTVSFALGALRWRLLARGVGVELGLGGALTYGWIGLFFSNVLPSGFGGDAVRAWLAGRRAGAVSTVAASVLMDRVVAAWALVGVGAFAVVVERHRLPAVAITGCLLAGAVVAVISVLLLARTPGRALVRATRRSPRISHAIASVAAAFADYRTRPGVLARALAVSLISQACVVAAAYLLARAIGLTVPIGLLAACIPVALLATTVPSTINGLGIREAVFRVLLVPAGVPASKAVAFSLLTVIAAALVSAPGAVAWVASRRRAGSGRAVIGAAAPIATSVGAAASAGS
jgi:uncharacterized protein (TIRG00374 family)